MIQVKIYGVDEIMRPVKQKLSDVIYSCTVDSLKLNNDKRIHRFFPLDIENFLNTDGRNDANILIEIILIKGQTTGQRTKKLVQLLFERLDQQLGISPIDIEVCILESTEYIWASNGVNGDKICLSNKVGEIDSLLIGSGY